MDLPRRRPLPELALVALTVAWGFSFVGIPWALRDAGYLTLTSLRMAIGLAFLVALRPSCLLATAFEWRTGILGGTLLSAGYLLQTAGLSEASAGKGAFLTAFYIALVPLLEVIAYRRRPAAFDLVILLVATVGCAVLALGSDFTLGFGEGLVALSALFWAGQIVVVGRAAERVDPMRLAAVQLLVTGAIPFALRVLWIDEPPVRWTGSLVGLLLFLGVVTNALGFLGQAWAQRRIPPTRVAILYSAEPVFAAVFGVTLQDESFGVSSWVGASLVMAAILLTLRRPQPPVAEAVER